MYFYRSLTKKYLSEIWKYIYIFIYNDMNDMISEFYKAVDISYQ